MILQDVQIRLKQQIITWTAFDLVSLTLKHVGHNLTRMLSRFTELQKVDSNPELQPGRGLVTSTCLKSMNIEF